MRKRKSRVGTPRRIVPTSEFAIECKKLGGDLRVRSMSEFTQVYGTQGTTFMFERQFNVDCAALRDWFNKHNSVDLVVEYLIAGKKAGQRVLSGCTAETYTENMRTALDDDNVLLEVVTVKVSEVGPFVKVEKGPA